MANSMEVQTAQIYSRAVMAINAKMVANVSLFLATVNTVTAAPVPKVTQAQGARFPPPSLSKRLGSYTSKQFSWTQWHF